MTRQDIERMERAIGIIEGVAYVADAKTSDALIAAIEILDEVLLNAKTEN